MSYILDTYRTIVVRVFLLAAGIVSGIINVRWLGPEGIGIFSLLILLPQFFFRFSNLGLGSSLAFFMASITGND